MKIRNTTRNRKGAAIIEAMIGIMLLIAGAVFGVLLLINAGAATHNKERIQYIAKQGANYASALPSDSTRQGKVTAMVNGLIDNMGMSSAGTNVSVSDTTVNGEDAVEVTVDTSLRTILAANFSNALPSQFRMSSRAVAVKNGWYQAYGKCILPSTQMLTIPLFNGTGVLPNDGMPAYTISLVGIWKIR